nr:immunoglobulin heavy chain junction region [Macaca mulatta]MOX62559.1 immunoglobulin heavy chain junction region [Macaca mulatta]MOX62797.1 immunoglobulin heavy chain junction region [Macaca mulatta]MOX63146.1 immunoglobulin heavy chain junction region [Macaca mulatta]MOX67293.1 immunoglobulin heavy chain junction region [Macaca mulatta]
CARVRGGIAGYFDYW